MNTLPVRIRLQRCGRPKKPFYRIVVIDSRAGQKERPIEQIGHYNPLLTENKDEMNEQRLNYWLKCGARPSDTVASLIKSKMSKIPVEPVRVKTNITNEGG